MRSLQKKLFISYMAVILVMLIGFALGVSWVVKENITINRQHELVERGQELANLASEYLTGNESYQSLHEAVDGLDNVMNVKVWIVDDSYKVISTSVRRGQRQNHEISKGAANNSMHSNGMRSFILETQEVLNGQVIVKKLYHPYYNENMMFVAVPVYTGEKVAGAVILSTPIKEMNAFLKKIYLYIALTGLIAFIIAWIIMNKLTHDVVRPLIEMQHKAAAMAQGDYSQKVHVRTQDEVGALGLALNALGQDLERFVEQTEKVEKMRRDFVANVSHELRTPLTIIRGYHEALTDGTVTNPEQVTRYQKLIGEEIGRLERLIHNLLELSRLQAGTRDDIKEAIPLTELIKNVVQMFQPTAAQAGISLNVNCNEAEAVIMGHGDRLTQLLLILLDNAIRYTKAGGNILVSLKEQEDNIQLLVQDTGIGISEEDLTHIWERFYKVDKAHTRSSGGTGLGLAIAKEIIEMHEADVKVQSELGKGTKFMVTFNKN